MLMAPGAVCVLGAGVVGLSTAVQLQVALPDVHVTLVADGFGAETTSHGAAGIFRPTPGKTPGVPLNKLRRWLRDSWRHFDSLAHSAEAGEAGVQIVNNYQLVDFDIDNPLERDFTYNYRRLTSAELEMFPGVKYKYGVCVTTLMTESTKYLPYLMKRFVSLGGVVIQKKITDLNELVGVYDVTVNCTGMGSEKLFGDTKLVPIRGQALKMRAPWIKVGVGVGNDFTTFIYPGQDSVTVGCTRQTNDREPNSRADDTRAILQRACKVMPSLQNAEIITEWVGFRPHRDPLRLEAETINLHKGKLKVVHNYGHGAEGVSLSWGTATEAVTLVRNMLHSSCHSKL